MTTQNHRQGHGEASERSTVRPRNRGGVLSLWIILGALFCGAVGHLLGMALPGDLSFGAGIGLGAGVALGAAIGTRRADANDREVVRRAEEGDDL